MNILYSAFACNPYKGSEAVCGWSWIDAMNNVNKTDNIYVLTRYENKPYIDKYINENGKLNVEFLYCDVPQWMNLYEKFNKFYFVYYLLWQNFAYKYIKKQKNITFDIIHHITLGDFRVIGKLWKIKNAKFIFGPVGGGQVTPKCFKKYVKKHKYSENIRVLINNIVKFNPFYIRALNHSYKIFCANQETAQFIKPVVKEKDKINILTENGVLTKFLEQTKQNEDKKKKQTIKIMWAGRMIYRKGLKILLETLSQVQTNKDIKLYLFGSGPEEEELKIFSNNQGLKKCVVFKGNCEYKKMLEQYKDADLFVFPSIRETTGTVLFEAMANYLPIISFNQNGAKILVKENTGILIELNNLEQVKEDFKNAIETLINNDDLRIKMGKLARKEIEENYTWEKKCINILKEYRN